MTIEQKAAHTLTRCGPFSRQAAEAYLGHLLPTEIEQLAALQDECEQGEHEHYATQGQRFQAVLDAAADRPAKPTAEPEPAADPS